MHDNPIAAVLEVAKTKGSHVCENFKLFFCNLVVVAAFLRIEILHRLALPAPSLFQFYPFEAFIEMPCSYLIIALLIVVTVDKLQPFQYQLTHMFVSTLSGSITWSSL
jgi:hypothetical protein